MSPKNDSQWINIKGKRAVSYHNLGVYPYAELTKTVLSLHMHRNYFCQFSKEGTDMDIHRDNEEPEGRERIPSSSEMNVKQNQNIGVNAFNLSDVKNVLARLVCF